MRKTLMVAIACVLLTVPGYAEEIRIIGGAPAITTVFSPIKNAYEEATGDSLVIDVSDNTDSLIALEKRRVDVAAINLFAVESGIEHARKRGVVIDPSSLHRQQVAMSSLVVFTNKTNPVIRLNKEQLKGIFTGRITNWQEVGGEDREIVVLWGTETNFLNPLFQKTILDGEKITSRALEAGDHYELRQLVMEIPGGIAINTSGLIMPKIKVPKIPPIPLPIIAVTKGEPSARVQRVLSFYQKEYGFLDE